MIDGLNGVGGHSAPFSYWQTGQGLGNITPRNKDWPEGKDFAGTLSRMFKGQRVCEFGCGVGRLARCFFPLNYVGVDICPQAVEAARERNPEYDFYTLTGNPPMLPPADAMIAHTVLLHIPDEEIGATIASFRHRAVVVSEVMGRRWRREGNPPVFNRDEQDYIDLFADHGYTWKHTLLLPYPHYKGEHLSMICFERANA